MENNLTSVQIDELIIGGKILSNALKEVIEAVKPGMSASSLDEIAEREIRRLGGQPSFKNYGQGSEKPFPASLCVSINSDVVHGFPSKDKIIKEGDLVSLDLGCCYKNLFTDMAMTVAVGQITDKERKLLDVCKKSLKLGIAKAKEGNCIGDIGYEIQHFVESNGFSVVHDLVGHGVGLKVHDNPQIPNFGSKNRGPKIKEAMGLAIEPMVNIGSADVVFSTDGWTVATRDGSKSAHFEQTIVTTKNNPIIITPFI
jgi:methionyl aminopeptidase